MGPLPHDAGRGGGQDRPALFYHRAAASGTGPAIKSRHATHSPAPTPLRRIERRAMTDVLDQLRRARAGLLYPSESDEPFEPFCCRTPDADPAKVVAKQTRPGTTIQEQPVD